MKIPKFWSMRLTPGTLIREDGLTVALVKLDAGRAEYPPEVIRSIRNISRREITSVEAPLAVVEDLGDVGWVVAHGNTVLKIVGLQYALEDILVTVDETYPMPAWLKTKVEADLAMCEAAETAPGDTRIHFEDV